MYKRQNNVLHTAWNIEFSGLVGFGEDRLREKGSLPATFYVVTRDIFS